MLLREIKQRDATIAEAAEVRPLDAQRVEQTGHAVNDLDGGGFVFIHVSHYEI